MKNSDILSAGDSINTELKGGDFSTVREAAIVIRLVFIRLRERASGWKFWTRYALDVAIAALDVLIRESAV